MDQRQDRCHVIQNDCIKIPASSQIQSEPKGKPDYLYIADFAEVLAAAAVKLSRLARSMAEDCEDANNDKKPAGASSG